MLAAKIGLAVESNFPFSIFDLSNIKVLESDRSVATMENATAVSSTETFEELLYGAEVEVWDNVNDLRSSGEVCMEKAQKSETEELAANSAHVSTMGTNVTKRVEASQC